MNILPSGGRGDLASTMLWSPRKHASQKRPLESEEEKSDDEILEEEEIMLKNNQDERVLVEGDQRQHKAKLRDS